MFDSKHLSLQGLVYPAPPMLAVEMIRVLLRSIGRTHWGLVLLYIVLIAFTDTPFVRLEVLALGAIYSIGAALNRIRLRKFIQDVDTNAWNPSQLATELNRTLGLQFVSYATYGLSMASVPWVMDASASLQTLQIVTILLLSFGFAQSIVLSALPAMPSICQAIVALSLALCWLTSKFPHSDLIALAILAFVTISLRGAWRMTLSLHETVRTRLQLAETLETMHGQARDLQSAIVANRNSEKEKARLFSAANHDLRQPVSAASLYVGILIGRLEKIPAQYQPALRDSIGKIDSAIMSVDGIISSMSDLSKLEADQLSPRPYRIDLRVVVHNLLDEMEEKAKGKAIQIHANVPSLALNTDPALLARLLRNLLDNSFKYAAGQPVSIYLALRDDRHTLIIEDNGPGVPQADLETVFNPYVQLDNPERDRSKGLGLGLAIVRKFSEVMHMRTWLELREPKGLRACVDIQDVLADAVNPNAEQVAAPLPENIRGKRILIIDDDEDIRYALRILLSDWGCIAHCFGTLEQAIHHLTSTLTLPSLVLLDNRLPSVEGVDATLQLRRMLPTSNIVLITGDTGAQVEERARQANLPIVYKPISPDKLRRLIAQPTLV
jgi:signal transduction histidine kinase